MSLTRNTVLNLGGQVLPLLVAVFVFPALWQALGRDMFGMLLLIWSIISYFSLFDLGLGRALTRMTAQARQGQVHFAICDIVLVGLLVMAGIGVSAALLAGLLIPWGAPVLVPDGRIAPQRVAHLLALTSYAIPLTTVGLCFRAALEGLQRFDLTAAVRLPFALFLLGSPYIVVLVGGELEQVVITLLIGIFATGMTYSLLLRVALRDVRSCSHGKNRMAILYSLAKYSGWVSVSNLIAPLLYYVDRFVISALLGVGIMSYYVTPNELISKTLIVASAISGAFFPRLSEYSHGKLSEAVSLVRTGTKLNFLLTFPVALVCCIWAESLLRLWMGEDVARHGSRVLQILACGVLLNAAAYMPFTFLQAVGRPDLTARLHLIELPLYAAALAFVIPGFGIVGAAYAWALRALIELVGFTFMTAGITGVKRAKSDLVPFVASTAILLAISYSDLLQNIYLRAALVSLASVLTFIFFWKHLLDELEKEWLLGAILGRAPA